MTTLVNALAVLALIGMAVAIPLGVIDTARQCLQWTPPPVDPPVAWRVLPRANEPYDYEREDA